VPISCPPCSITLTIVNPLGLTVSACSRTFSASDTQMTGRPINIRAVPTAGSNSRSTRLQFRPLDTLVSGSGWDDYTIKPIPVSKITLSDSCMTCLTMMMCGECKWKRCLKIFMNGLCVYVFRFWSETVTCPILAGRRAIHTSQHSMARKYHQHCCVLLCFRRTFAQPNSTANNSVELNEMKAMYMLPAYRKG